MDNNSTDFPTTALTINSNNTLTVDRGTCACGYQTGVTGDKVVATVHFKANTPGTGTVNFASGSVVVSATTNLGETMTYAGGTYTITPTGTMTLSPATKTVTKGDSFDVAIYENSHTDSLNGVQANLSYNPNLLSVGGITPNSSVWPVQAENSASNGLIKIGRGTTTPVTGSQLVATVKFSAIATGGTQVSFTTGTGLIRSIDNSVEPSINTGGSYTVNAPAPTVSGGSGSTNTNNTGSTAAKPLPLPKSITSAPAAKSSPVTTALDTSPPVISNIKVTNVTTKSATVSWTTSEPATSEVDFGLGSNYILSTSDGALATSHSIALNPKDLVGHKTYHFIVKSTDAAGNQSVSKDMTFDTGGIQITTTEIAVVAGAAILGGGAWLMAAAGGLKLGGGMMAASGGGIYVEPKPIILGGGTPPPQPAPVIHPQPAAPAAPVSAPAPTPAPKVQVPTPKPQAQTPGKVVNPKSAPADTTNQTLPKWVKKK